MEFDFDYELEFLDFEERSDSDNIGCGDCPDGECTGHCMSCFYRPV